MDKDGKPEEEKVKKLIDEFEDWMEWEPLDWRVALHDFIVWMYVEKKFIILPQDKLGRSTISDIHLR